MITILNTSILTSYGGFSYEQISLQQARSHTNEGFQSAVGHESTAKIISALLEVECPVNRIQYKQEEGEVAIVFKLNGRPEEGKILTVEEIEKIGYEWGYLKKLSKESCYI